MSNEAPTGPRPKIKILGRRIHLPRSRKARVGLGAGFVVGGGLFGWMPVLGYWMVPVGLFILAHDSPTIRRFNRRAGVWLKRKFRKEKS